MPSLRRLVDDGGFGRAGVGGGEDEGFGKVIDAVGDMDGDGFLAGELAGGIAGGGQGGERGVAGAGVGVLAGGGDVEIGGKGGQAAEHGQGEGKLDGGGGAGGRDFHRLQWEIERENTQEVRDFRR